MNDLVLAVDPGPTESAYVYLRETGDPAAFGKVPNEELLALLSKHRDDAGCTLAVEMIASYGMPVGAETFETCVWIGRFIERWAGKHRMVFRQQVKQHLCKTSAAKDSNIRMVLIDMWGSKDVAIGNKKNPGPLYGMKADVWQALAVAVTFAEGGVK